MTKTSRRARWRAAAGQAAAAAGHAARVGPGLAGALCVAYGLKLAWPPLGFIALGVFLLLADRRVP
jgi:hypothetical protein